MKSKMPCEVVRDLFPSYIDKLTSEVTNREIDVHLEECGECRSILEKMTDPDTIPEIPEDSENEKEIDFLKKTRKRTKRIFLGSIAVVVIFLIAFLCKNYYIGSSLNSEFVLYHVEVKESEITLTGSLLDENLSVKSIDFSDKNGIVKVAFQAVRRGLFGKNTFKGKYRLASGKEIKEIWIDNRIIWKDGETISPQTAEVYNARNPYVGDMSANGKLVSVLQMETRLGTFSSELKTKEQPYVWKMIFQDTDELKGFDVERAKSYAYILLAEVENLSEISFEYIEQGKVHQFSVTAEDATEYAGDNIKEIGKNVNKLQKLIESTHIMDISYASENVNEKDAIQINLANQTESDITSVAMELDVDGSLAGVQSGSNADGSFVKSGEVLNFELLPEDFDTELSGKEVVTLVFTVCDKNGTWHNDVKQGSYNQFVNKISGYLEISPEFGRTYNFRLTGNEKEGYEISQ